VQTNFSTKIILALLTLSALAATAIPYAWTRFNAGDEWRGVVPETSYDAMYYFARANDVTRGHLFVTSPYFFEHRNTPFHNPTFTDPIVALPQILGLSFNTGYYLNIFLWALIFLVLLYVFFRAHVIPPVIGFLGALWCYVGLYGDMLRPGVMQVIYPLYIFFLLFFLRYINKKESSVLPLAIVTGITAYFYIFLFMVVAATLGIYFMVVLLRRDWAEFRRICLTGVIAVAVALPHIARIFYFSLQDFYKESLMRQDLFYSHWPQIEAYYYGRWVVLVLLLGYLLRRYIPEKVSGTTHFFVMMSGAGILLAMVSNIFTGQDFNIATHIGRFGIMWYLAVGVFMLVPVYEFLVQRKGEWPKRGFIGLLFLLLIYQMFANITRAIPRFSEMKEQAVGVQTYAGVLDWLGNAPEGVVVAPNDLNSYIPTLTKQYVLYNRHGAYFLLSDDEYQERFLLYHALDKLTFDDFIGSTVNFGLGPTELAKTSMLQHRLCLFFRAEEDCLPARSERSFLDMATLKKKFDTLYPSLIQNIDKEYAKYHVSYIILKVGESHPMLETPSCPIVYQDQWFEVCEITQRP